MNKIHQNTLMPRAYYIPSSMRMDNLITERESSPRMQALNGSWRFRYYENKGEDCFWTQDYDCSSYNMIEVPGTWQLQGYDANQYTNIRYPFPFNPPHVPADNPCGAYICDFEYTIDAIAPVAHLNFEGVDSCFYVWVNGKYVGYSQVSHATSEFDITDKLLEGKNRLAVLVVKWCSGSYLEDQDKFRMSGIFRDVYILKRPKEAVRDYFIKTNILRASMEDVCEAEVSINVKYFSKIIDTRLSLYDMANQEVEIDVTWKPLSENKALAVFSIPKPELWSAEHPYLYKLYIETDKEVITEYIGVREVSVRENVLFINGQNIVFAGVNRHEADPITGCTISIEQMIKDFKLMKEHNVNAIRTSHYPDVPVFYQLCDKFGFYVIDEADIEAHGPVSLYYEDEGEEYAFNEWNKPIADNPYWEEAIIDRVTLLVERDKNRPCVVIWSMGNESAYGCNFEKALEWTKGYDQTRLTHYESARYTNKDKEYDYSCLDLYSRMYPLYEEVDEYVNGKADKPFILCEYSHSMGNGPGDLEDYFWMFHQHDVMCGGFVWEWCDHAIYGGIADNERSKYYYGGDSGEKIHDGNFCVDGLVSPDRIPHTGLKEFKNVYRPLRVKSYNKENGELHLHNYMDFTAASDYIKLCCELSVDGEVIYRKHIDCPFIVPHGEGTVSIKINVPDEGKCFLRLYYYMKCDSLLVKKGHSLGYDEILIENKDGRNNVVKKIYEENSFDEIDILSETEDILILAGKNFRYEYDKRKGMLLKLEYGGRQYLDKPMMLNIWRAPTDNDMYIKDKWIKAGYDNAYTDAYYNDIVKYNDRIDIYCKLFVVAPAAWKIADVELKWTVWAGGMIDIAMNVVKKKELPDLPRFGLRLFVDKFFDKVTYYGMGPYESYVDKNKASLHGKYSSDIRDMHIDYIMPQENGSHYDCDYVKLHNEDETGGLLIASNKAFSFNASVYTQEELACKMHNYELCECGSSVLCMDYALNGIGSNSCGPYLMEKYRFNQKEFTFEVRIRPYKK